MSDKVYLESFCWTGTKIGEQIKFQGDLNPQSRSRDGQEKHSPTCRGQGTSRESFFFFQGWNLGSGEAWQETLLSMNCLLSPKSTF